MVSSGLAPHKLPRALDSLLMYQQPSSTTLYYSCQERLSLNEAGLSNETGGNYRRINIKSCSSEQGVWSPQTWRHTRHHVRWIAYCCINSLRQPYRPALTHYRSLSHQRVPFVLRLRQSFPEDCARLKLSSARASQAGLREMMMQMKNEIITR